MNLARVHRRRGRERGGGPDHAALRARIKVESCPYKSHRCCPRARWQRNACRFYSSSFFLILGGGGGLRGGRHGICSSAPRVLYLSTLCSPILTISDWLLLPVVSQGNATWWAAAQPTLERLATRNRYGRELATTPANSHRHLKPSLPSSAPNNAPNIIGSSSGGPRPTGLLAVAAWTWSSTPGQRHGSRRPPRSIG